MRLFAAICAVAIALGGFRADAQMLTPFYSESGQFGYVSEGTRTFVIKPQWDEARPFNDKGVAVVRKGRFYSVINLTGKPAGDTKGTFTIVAPYDGTDLWLVAVGGKYEEDESKITNRERLFSVGFKGSTSYPIKGAKWGLLRPDGTYCVPPKYQEISNLLQEEYIVVQAGNKLGMININDVNIIPVVNDLITPINRQGLCAARIARSEKWCLYNIAKSKTVIPETAGVDGIDLYYDDNLYGAANTVRADSLICDRELWNESGRYLPLCTRGSTWIDSDVPYIKTSKIVGFGMDRTIYTLLYDINGNLLVGEDIGLNYITNPSEGISVVLKDDVWMGYNLKTQTNFDTGGRGFTRFAGGRALRVPNDENVDKYVFIDTVGQPVSKSYDRVSYVGDRIIAKAGERYDICDFSGNILNKTPYNSAYAAADGLFVVKDTTSTAGYVDKDGNTVIPFKFVNAGSFRQGERERKHTYASMMVTDKPAPKKRARRKARTSRKSAATTVAAVKPRELYGVIDREGKTVVPFQSLNMCVFEDSNGETHVWSSDSTGVKKYDFAANAFQPCEYGRVYYDTQMDACVVADAEARLGLYDYGKEIVPCVIDDAATLAALYAYMRSAGIREISASQARAIAVRLDDKRNSFNLSDRIDQKYWDY